MKPLWWIGIPSLAVGLPPLPGDLLSLLPQQRYIRDSIARRMCHTLVTDLCHRFSHGSPFSTTPLAIVPTTTTTTMKWQSTSAYQAVEDEQEPHNSAAEDDGGCQERTLVEEQRLCGSGRALLDAAMEERQIRGSEDNSGWREAAECNEGVSMGKGDGRWLRSNGRMMVAV